MKERLVVGNESQTAKQIKLCVVFSALANEREGKRSFVPYRDTKLTRLLREEFGGNCVTTLVCYFI